ncbi:MAG: chemotaxis protein CheW [Candidatus Omnitrophica bacterium CG11_big_fil_rev_8_21_14_0_20_42_13]|uniref:Chemotaxis protein CheW n=1 Tax=Candidatus Ghiorseimicrobium undicola TaxID=1974746 RepID=A0A2H0LY38_9BACT|nr:MAG: chemotaxis protein CheW [Candidatus Omnitrophica bacterium CG11_big_fil_rev_8_21_14_0_20_42_13]
MHEHQNNKEAVNIVIFTLAGDYFAVDVKNIREILMFREISPIPKTPSFIEGVINLRGHIIGIVDLRKYFDLKVSPTDKDTRIMIVRLKDALLGLIVDSVIEVVSLTREAIESAPAVVSSQIDNNLVSSVAKIGDNMVMILDLESVLGEEQVKHLVEIRNTPRL